MRGREVEHEATTALCEIMANDQAAARVRLESMAATEQGRDAIWWVRDQAECLMSLAASIFEELDI